MGVARIAENDIYDSESKYERLKETLEKYLDPPSGKRELQIKFQGNLRHFDRMFAKLEARDTSFKRRLRLCTILLGVCTVIEKDLVEVTRDDMDRLMAWANQRNKSPVSKQCWVRQIRFLWKQLFAEKDEHGREDETLVPYVVRHLSGRVDKSTERLRQDRLTLEEFDRLVAAFSDDSRMQALITLAFESLGRPQELLGRRLKDIELHDNYAKVIISEHGKEGIGILRCIDSYFYLAKWLNEHPFMGDPEAWLFINLGNRGKYGQLKPEAANIQMKRRLARLGIKKPITLYSLKRNGVTHCRLRGDSDVDIQHRARWTSTKQLKTYDLSHHEDTFKLELVKRGMLEPGQGQEALTPRVKTCAFCKSENGVAETVCRTCKRPLDRKAVEKDEQDADGLRVQFEAMQSQMSKLNRDLEQRRQYDQVLVNLLEGLEERGRADEIREVLKKKDLMQAVLG